MHSSYLIIILFLKKVYQKLERVSFSFYYSIAISLSKPVSAPHNTSVLLVHVRRIKHIISIDVDAKIWSCSSCNQMPTPILEFVMMGSAISTKNFLLEQTLATTSNSPNIYIYIYTLVFIVNN